MHNKADSESYGVITANRLEREMGVREALLHVQQLAAQHGLSTSAAGGTANIIARLATKGIWL